MELHVIEREGRETVVLLDNEMRIVKPVYDYLKFQKQKDKALNTLKASGSDLRTYWEFLNDSGYEYDKVTPKMIAEFIDYLRASDDDVIALNKESKRTNKTINRILSTIHMFYQFEADMQEIDNPILMHDVNRPFNAFKANKDKCVAGLCDGYCTKPVTDGNICPKLLKRQKCYTCSRYITTPEYLEAHKQHLANLEKQLEEGAIYGEHYAEHFIPTIEVLKVIIERLEGLQNGN